MVKNNKEQSCGTRNEIFLLGKLYLSHVDKTIKQNKHPLSNTTSVVEVYFKRKKAILEISPFFNVVYAFSLQTLLRLKVV